MTPAEAEAKAALRTSMAIDPIQTIGRKPAMAADKRINFDPTINLGHLLTAAAMLLAGYGAYAALERRVAVVEDRQAATTARADEKAQETKEAVREIRQDVKDVQRTVNDLSRVISKVVR